MTTNTWFVWSPSNDGTVLVQIDGHEITTRQVIQTVIVGVPIGDGCVNDTGEDRWMWRAEYHGRVAVGTTPEAAARAVLIR